MDYSILEALNDQNEYPRKVRFRGPGKWISGILMISEVGFILFPRVHTVSPQEVHRPGNLTFHENSFWPFRAATRSPCPFACVSGSRGSSARAAPPKPPHVKIEFPNSSLRGPVSERGPRFVEAPPPPNLIGIPAAFSQKMFPKMHPIFSSRNVPARRDRAFPPTEVTFQSRKCGRIILQNRLGN